MPHRDVTQDRRDLAVELLARRGELMLAKAAVLEHPRPEEPTDLSDGDAVLFTKAFCGPKNYYYAAVYSEELGAWFTTASPTRARNTFTSWESLIDWVFNDESVLPDLRLVRGAYAKPNEDGTATVVTVLL